MQAINQAATNTSSSAKSRWITKKRRMRKVLVFPGDDEDFTIDEHDYLVIREIFLALGIFNGDNVETRVRDKVQIQECDEGRRVYGLNLETITTDGVPWLPISIEQLENLTYLTLSHLKITSLPHSIGQLQNLKNLDLAYTENLLRLPEDIGDLPNLNTWSLSKSGITMLPPSIGQLQNLKFLDLSSTLRLLQLPEEIGNLANLNKLDLRQSGITMLPHSIGQLQNLKILISLTQRTC
jgi:Leucine-rich repeat (LRR) protein